MTGRSPEEIEKLAQATDAEEIVVTREELQALHRHFSARNLPTHGPLPADWPDSGVVGKLHGKWIRRVDVRSGNRHGSRMQCLTR